MLTVIAPAPLVDTMALHRRDLRMRRLTAKVLILQLHKSETFGLVDEGGRLFAAVGFLPLVPEREGETLFELWFLCAPELSRHILQLVRLARLIFRRMAESGDVRIRALVRAGHSPGRRLAVLCGMTMSGDEAGFERWEWSFANERSGQGNRRNVLGDVAKTSADRGKPGG